MHILTVFHPLYYMTNLIAKCDIKLYVVHRNVVSGYYVMHIDVVSGYYVVHINVVSGYYVVHLNVVSG